MGQWEREAISERTRAVLQHKKANRLVYNRSVYGFDKHEGQLVENPFEQSVIAHMRALRPQGMSHHRIADQLNMDSTPTKHGRGWGSQTVCNILGANVVQKAG